MRQHAQSTTFGLLIEASLFRLTAVVSYLAISGKRGFANNEE